ncbi:MAG: nickel pincer cofactor biosynthesis protein LarB [Lachnospiraceae bacterium]|nr:nickel pincer cofactor biosynthesis protein LarB [Lachnospiraceae bacterium]
MSSLNSDFSNKDSYEEMGFAKLDTSRTARSGFPEVVFCQGKADSHLISIYGKLYEKNKEVFGTRANEHQANLITSMYPKLPVKYDPLSRILSIAPEQPRELVGAIAVCSAGTADLPIAEEAAQTAEYFGTKVRCIYDVGVSGIHRLLAQTEELHKVNCVIAVAGMEGALASVIGGLVSVPVIAVPTSVGYGANLGGISALLTMINTCANGVTVVNIDNGYGAGYVATQINRLAVSHFEG